MAASEAASAVRASWFDGLTAVKHEGVAAALDGNLLLRADAEPGDRVEDITVPASELQYLDKRADGIIYGRGEIEEFRLILPADPPPAIAALLPTKSDYGAWIDRHGLLKMTAGFAAVSVTAVALFMTAPNWLGPMVPERWERNMGEAMIGDFGGRLCSTPESDAALAKLVRTMDPGSEEDGARIKLGIANFDMVNAVALPGGQVLLFDGLLQEAERQDEVTGVLAHEVGHVRERHVMTAVLRQFGLSILSAGLGGGYSESALGIASLDYSREAETEADEFARERLREVRVSPDGAAAFFDRVAEEYEDTNAPAITGWLATHPAAKERADAYRASKDPQASYRDILTKREYAAILSACKNDPDVEEFDFF
ncbi:Beta-barrel assembly-enhancing protease [Alteripontixanthobacter maritimus]|uniref:Beta-barrel assembly-enhancing protease n=1 Tax=Alteripontixanthobacter maritimus TaxID=2161824 RepID=A0A369Q8P8_9SPHN|nr:M48 family metallopeptidase [Alteripontixanthobacter maritimus]RDC61261.1 Beta-barrel assembly-enhancing protease [Alteripontixanthobacter maritimus]